MTIEDIIKNSAGFNLILLVFFLFLPLAALALRFIFKGSRGSASPGKYFYSVLVYLACVPGILASLVTAYSLVFLKKNLLQVNVIFHFLPVISMILTLIIIRKSLTFDEIPGFDKLYGLMLLLAVCFIIALILERLRIWLFFGGSIGSFVIMVIGLFLLLKYAGRKIFRGFRKK